mmetsp:Transcript_22895/g.71340  ORF Transcript_22895/g.71340 Transcript_22895/m.71340 type:complete len:291 (-) Transcript_22895:177-1049(-)
MRDRSNLSRCKPPSPEQASNPPLLPLAVWMCTSPAERSECQDSRLMRDVPLLEPPTPSGQWAKSAESSFSEIEIVSPVAAAGLTGIFCGLFRSKPRASQARGERATSRLPALCGILSGSLDNARQGALSYKDGSSRSLASDTTDPDFVITEERLDAFDRQDHRRLTEDGKPLDKLASLDPFLGLPPVQVRPTSPCKSPKTTPGTSAEAATRAPSAGVLPIILKGSCSESRPGPRGAGTSAGNILEHIFSGASDCSEDEVGARRGRYPRPGCSADGAWCTPCASSHPRQGL